MKAQSKLLQDKRLRLLQKQETRDYLQFSFVVLTITIFTAFAIRPSISRAFRLNKQIHEYQELDRKLTNKIINLKQARERYNMVLQYIPLLNKTIPNQANDGQIINDLSYSAAKNEVQLQNASFSYSKQGKSINEIQLSITVKGKYTSIISFVADINNSLRLINIESMVIEPDENSNGIFVTITIEAKAYHYLNTQDGI